MKHSYLDYAMSVIVARALPDVRDGLKPVHRRILYAMKEGGYDRAKPFRKSARIVGDVMGKYHPHGDAAIYDAMVRMAQDFSMRLMLIEGQGNFGSMDGDPPAAMRYTEARLARSAEAILEDFDKGTVDFKPSYDGNAQEPAVLPARFPNLLVNGAGGIAVGMATNIPTHNLGEVIDACCAYVDNPEITIDELMEHLPGPDFPTAGIILGRTGIHEAYHTGRGSIVMRGRAEIEEIRKDRQAIVITEIPYQVNKSRMVERIAELVRDKTIEGIVDLRDESDRHGVRVVVEVRRDIIPEVVLNQLYRYTPLQTSFGVNMLALNRGQPEMMNLKDIIALFIDFREQVITRRTIFELNKARARSHILLGLAIAVINLDPVIALIRKASDPATARAALRKPPWPAGEMEALIRMIDEPEQSLKDGAYRLSEEQAKAILELRLHRLTGLERDKIVEDLKALVEQISGYLEILGSRERLLEILRRELQEMKEEFATPRRTQIEEIEFEHDIEDLIQREEMVVTVTHTGYIKRVPLSTYRAQRRGGKGRAGMATREEDFVSQVFVVNTHTPVLFFSSRGIVYKMKVYRLPLGAPQARGKALVNLLPLEEEETITTLMPMPEDEQSWGELHVMFATATGHVRRNKLSDFVNVMAKGKIAMKLKNGDQLVGVQTCTEDDDVLFATGGGKCIRFPATDVRVFSGRSSIGVRGIRLASGDKVISMSILTHIAADPKNREEYLQAVNAKHRLASTEYTGKSEEKARDEQRAARLDEQNFVEMAEHEEFILTVAENGFGKRTSGYDYRIARRGGKGIGSMELERDGNAVVAAFTVTDDDQIILMTDGGQIIRCPVNGIRVARRTTRGVTVFKLAKGEKVVSVSRHGDVGAEGDGEEAGEGEEAADGAAESEATAVEDDGKGDGGAAESEATAVEDDGKEDEEQ